MIRNFLAVNRAEVKNMFLTEYNEEKVLEQERKEGRNERNLEVATDMLKEGDSLSKVVRISQLTEESVRNLAKSLGIVIL